MSCYVVQEEHINYLVNAGMRLNQRERFSWLSPNGRRVSLHGNYGDAGQMLWDENVMSFNSHYEDHQQALDAYTYTRIPNFIHDPVQVLMSCKCYEYQSCEHAGWEKSEAKAFIDSLKETAIRALDGYDDKKWGAPDCAFPPKVIA